MGAVSIYYRYFLKLTLEQWSYVAQIVTAFSVIIALFAYRSQKEVSRQMNVAKQINFFRTEILSLDKKISSKINHVKPEFGDFKAIELIEEFSIGWSLGNRPMETLTQQTFWAAMEEKGFGEASDMVKDLLNALEELSINILGQDLVANPDMVSIKGTFVIFIEAYAWPMIMTAPYRDDMYPAIRALYKHWAFEITRGPDLEEIKKRVREDVDAAADKLKKTMTTEEYTKLRNRGEGPDSV